MLVIEKKIKTIKSHKKNFLHNFSQSLFLKFLLIFSGKNYEKNKKYLKNLLEKIKNYYKFSFVNLYLRIKYLNYWRLPFQHLNYLDKFILFDKIMKKKNIKFFLLGGTLLGAVRQESFAGRPTDVDVGIKDYDEKKLKNCIKQTALKECSKVNFLKYEDKSKKIQITFKSLLIDIAIFKKRKFGNKLMWAGDSKNKKLIQFSKTNLTKFITVKLYGKEFLSPEKPMDYLTKKYGKNWRIPDKKQYFWKKI